MKQNFTNNNVSNVEINQRAVSNRKGKAKFVRVVGNTTGSHLEGAKDSYGDLEHFEVEVEDFRKIIDWADFLKIDVEGHEATLICSTVKDHWAGVDAVLEIGNMENAAKIFNHGQTRNKLLPEDWLATCERCNRFASVSQRRLSLYFTEGKNALAW